MLQTNKFSGLSKMFIVLSAIALAISLFVPIWRIELDAPQYPEGLMLKIFANKIGGEVDIINGLNHYIGMKTLHTNDFIEFTILPYLISAMALLLFFAAFKGSKKWLYISFTSLAIFGVVAMADFWLWEYKYGHNLDPNAAIIVPGMAYQPPLIGFKQLLNFGAYSVPDIGGWLFILAGVLLLLAVLKETGFLKKFSKSKSVSVGALLIGIISLSSCADKGPQAISLNVDHCDNCRMTIAQGNFAAELITSKGRVYKFDDLHCLQLFTKAKTDIKVSAFYINDFLKNNELVDATKAWYITHETIKSPMGGNTAAFSTQKLAEEYGAKLNTKIVVWDDLNKN